MASSEIDQKALAALCKESASFNVLLSKSLSEALGISVMLSRKLVRARKLRKFDISRETRSVTFYHEILFLAKSGLGLTEVMILPYCQSQDSGPVFQVMASKLRASFIHVFCLYHNNPPLHQLRQKNLENPNGLGSRWMESRKNGHKESGVPSPVASERSYVTNPYAANGPSPAPTYNIPAMPLSPSRTAPVHPPGLGLHTIVDYNPPASSATYLMPACNYTLDANFSFSRTFELAEALLDASHPLRLSVALEYATFLFDCLGDFDASQQLCKRAILAVYAGSDTTNVPMFEDSWILVNDMATLARRGEAILGIDQYAVKPEKPVISPMQQVMSPPLHPPPTRELPTPPRQRSDSARIKDFPSPPGHAAVSSPGGVWLGPYMQVQGLGISHSPGLGGGLNGTPIRSATLIGSPTMRLNAENKTQQASKEHVLTEKESKRSRASSKSPRSGRRRTEGMGTEKERKRRAVERAEEELMRKRSATSEAGTVVRNA